METMVITSNTMKTEQEKVYIELSRDDMSIDSELYEVKFLGREFTYDDVMEFLEEVDETAFKNINNAIQSKFDEISNEYSKEEILEVLDYDYDYMEEESINTLSEIIEDYNGNFGIAYYEVDEILVEFNYNLKDIIEQYANFGIVGYPQWSYYIAPKDVDYNFIRDLCEGWNFYDIALLDNNGDVLDSIGQCYIPDEKTLVEYIENYFNLKQSQYKLVDNEYTKYFNLPKVKKLFLDMNLFN
ncbi:hypothetical protein JXA27_06500 [Aerococcaceae bacterium zg-B36]|uniref:hypothetical protein n=1 Tax=Aerococcaceae bacterium zg-252 TaxID=2796928 RepID=UPI001BD80818|nr:hypothetical protein [Aerococcaceae bacterium zg-B36]